MIWFTADTHFGHTNKKGGIVVMCNRPFKDVEHMDKVLINNWNARVKSNDTVYFLGDFAYRSKLSVSNYIDKLNGNIIFIRGNHDRNNQLKTKIEFIVIKMGGYRIKLVHDPKYVDRKYYFNFCGHVHQHWKFRKMEPLRPMIETESYIINVGVDVNNFMPVTFNEIISDFSRWKNIISNNQNT